jgi:hypothetical protein
MADLRRSLALRILWGMWGTAYRWSGDDPDSWDCSGLVIEILKSVGLFPRKGDTTAHGLFERFAAQRVKEIEAEPGCLVFWLNQSGRAVHVEMVVQVEDTEIYAMGASGGGPDVVDHATAMAKNAFVKVRPVASRTGLRSYADPFKRGE